MPNFFASVFTFSLSKTSRLKFSRTQGNSGRYLVAYLTQVNLHKSEVGIITHPSNLISPVDGQFSAKGTSDSQSASWVRCFLFNWSFVAAPAVSLRILGLSQEQRCQTQARQPSWWEFWWIDLNIKYQPDCPTKPIDHLHCIGDRESNYPRA